eukprot:g12084.t1
MPFQGYNYEDAIAVSARLVREDLLTTIHIDEIVMQLDPDEYLCTPEEIDALGYMSEGLVCDGVWLEAGDVAICARRRATALDATSDDEQPRVRRVPEGVRGRVIGSSIKQIEEYDGKAFVLRESAVVLLAYRCRIGVGDKLSGRHGNKGIVSIVVDDRDAHLHPLPLPLASFFQTFLQPINLPLKFDSQIRLPSTQDMPYLPDGTPIDVCLNPLGVPSRMNVGQIFENLLGSAGRWNGEEYRVGTFDEMFAEEASRGLVFDALRRAQESTGYKWLLDGETPGKTRVYDGRTGMPLDQPVTVGVSTLGLIAAGYIIKLCHMVKDKIHSRGFRLEKGYNMLTMQPIKGRKHGGGLRLGEMEVSGIIGHGASQLLQELLTLKSDDVFGRNETYEKLKQGEEVVLPKGATSEGYRTFRRELAARAAFDEAVGHVGRCLGHLQTTQAANKALENLWTQFPQLLASELANLACQTLWEAFERLARCQPKSSIDGHQVLAAARRILEGFETDAQEVCLRALHAFACCESTSTAFLLCIESSQFNLEMLLFLVAKLCDEKGAASSASTRTLLGLLAHELGAVPVAGFFVLSPEPLVDTVFASALAQSLAWYKDQLETESDSLDVEVHLNFAMGSLLMAWLARGDPVAKLTLKEHLGSTQALLDILRTFTDVDINTFENGSRLEAKVDNWEQLYKLFKKKGIGITKAEFDPVIHCAPGAAVVFIYRIYEILTKCAVRSNAPIKELVSIQHELPPFMRDGGPLSDSRPLGEMLFAVSQCGELAQFWTFWHQVNEGFGD